MKEQQSPEVSKTAARKALIILGGLAVVILVITAAVKNSLSEPKVSKIEAAQTETIRISSTPSTTRDFGGLSLNSPYAFGPAQDILSVLPAETRAVVERYAAFESVSSKPSIKVSRITYKSGTEIDVEKAMDGAMRAVAAKTGDTKPDFKPVMGTIDGHPTCRAEYSGGYNGKALQVDATFLQTGQEMWQVQILSIGDQPSISEAVLDSIHVTAR